MGLFWVDGNWFYGSVPGRLMADSWPQLRTLDLYDNNLTGPVPSELGDMPNLDWVQLQGNRLDGIVPANVIAPRRFNRLKLSHNPELRGCYATEGDGGSSGNAEAELSIV